MVVTPAKTCEFIQNSVLNGTDEGHIEFTYAIFVATLQYRDAAREAIRTDVETACPQYVPLATRCWARRAAARPRPAGRRGRLGCTTSSPIAQPRRRGLDRAGPRLVTRTRTAPQDEDQQRVKRGGRNLANRGCGHLSCAGARHGMGTPKRRLLCRA